MILFPTKIYIHTVSIHHYTTSHRIIKDQCFYMIKHFKYSRIYYVKKCYLWMFISIDELSVYKYNIIVKNYSFFQYL